MTRVRFTMDSLGLVTRDDPLHFHPRTVGTGDEGILIPDDEYPFSVPDGWILVQVDDLYAPVHPSMIEEIES